METSTTIKKRGRKKKILDEQEKPQTIVPEGDEAKDPIIQNNISFGGSGSEKSVVAQQKEKTKDTEKNNIMFGGLNITVHKAEQPDISSTAQNLRFGSLTASSSTEKNNKTNKETSNVIYGEVTKKREKKSLPSKMCEIVEYDSDNEKPPVKNIVDPPQTFSTTENKNKGYYLPSYPTREHRQKSQSRRLEHIFSSNSDTSLPTTSNLWCWWCCHNFKTEPCYLPTVHDEYRDRYVVIGNFCSWSCVKSYNIDIGDMYVNKRAYIIGHILKKLGIQSRNILAAPPRTVLKEFGGNIDIVQFRKASGEYQLSKPLSSLTVCIEPQSYLKRRNTLSLK